MTSAIIIVTFRLRSLQDRQEYNNIIRQTDPATPESQPPPPCHGSTAMLAAGRVEAKHLLPILLKSAAIAVGADLAITEVLAR